MFPTLYYFFATYISYKVVNILQPVVIPLTYFVVSKLTVKKTSIDKFDATNININSQVYLFDRELNFVKLQLMNCYDLDDRSNNNIIIGDNSYKILAQECNQSDINTCDFIVIKCDKHVMFKQTVYHKLFEISDISKKIFNDIYDKWEYLIINVENGICYYMK